MRSKLVYDLPTRIFHVTFFSLFLVAYWIAKNLDQDSIRFPLHMLLGFALLGLLMFRLLWGIVGSRTARFSSFMWSLPALREYLRNLLRSTDRGPAGHNPASSWMAVSVMSLTLGMVFSGLAMVQGWNAELMEEVHEICSKAWLVLAVLHVAGVGWHMLRKRDAIALSMVDGYKVESTEGEAIPDARKLAALGLLIWMGLVGTLLVTGYDSSTRTLKLGSWSLPLAEVPEDQDSSSDESVRKR
jgi:cytochrome b